MTEAIDALVIGAGPAGLMAAEALAQAGRRVVVAEAKPSPARKFLMAGKSGLNLTKVEAPAPFRGTYRADWLTPALTAFGPEEVQDWARSLGVDVFTGSSGRVFPVAMKASPLLRAWLRRLETLGVQLRTRWRWTGFADSAFAFDTPEGPQALAPKVTVLALGGASWSRLGSDGRMGAVAARKGRRHRPMATRQHGAVGQLVGHMAPHFGTAVKGAQLRAGDTTSRGEFIVSSHGLEGGGLYTVSRAVRDGAPLALDLMPDLPADEIARRLSRMNRPRRQPTASANSACPRSPWRS